MLTLSITIGMIGVVTILMHILLTITYLTHGSMMTLEKIIMITCGWTILGLKKVFYGWLLFQRQKLMQ